MLHLVRANSPYTVIILFILTLGLKLQALGHPVIPVFHDHQAIFGAVVRFFTGIWGASGTAFGMLTVVLTFGQALYLRIITIKHRLFGKPTYLPAFVYIILSSLHPAFGHFSAMLLLNWLVLGALDTILGFTRREDQPRTIFNAGFLLACAALLHFPAIAYLIFLVLALMLLRPFKPGEWVVAILGYVTPFYFAACLLYLLNKLPLAQSWPEPGISLPMQVNGAAYMPGLLVGCIILLGFGIYSLPGMIHRLPVATRRGWGAVITTLLIGLLVSIFTPRTEHAAWLGVAPPLSLLIVPAMMPEKRSRFATFTFYFLIVLVLYCQLSLRFNFSP